MTGWLVVIALATVAFAAAALLLRLPRQGWTLFGAALVFGLAGYAWQGSADQPSSPKAAMPQVAQAGDAMVEARRALFDEADPVPGYLTTSDGFARRGRYAEAAAFLRQGLADNPDHAEGWLALGSALVEHTGGVVTPAARSAFERAYAADPNNPGGPIMLGFAYLRMRDFREARAVWGELLADTPEDAPWREGLVLRIEALDELIAAGSRPIPPIAPR